MKCNVGTIDRIIRALLGVILLIWGIAASLWWAIVVGIILLVTAGIRFCPLYRLFGISTCKPESAQTEESTPAA